MSYPERGVVDACRLADMADRRASCTFNCDTENQPPVNSLTNHTPARGTTRRHAIAFSSLCEIASMCGQNIVFATVSKGKKKI